VHTPLAWVYATGFPKALDVGKQIDKMAGVERAVVGQKPTVHRGVSADHQYGYVSQGNINLTTPATPLAVEWDGWKVGNSCLKPAYECILWAQKPTQSSYTPEEIGSALFGKDFRGWCDCEEE